MIASFVIAIFSIFLVGSAIGQQPKRPLLGGYRDIDVNGANVKTAAEFAVEAESKRSEKDIELISVIKAEQQVVQGTNIRMCLKVSDPGAEGQDAAEVFVKAVVNFDLKNNKKLLSWDASDCGEDQGGESGMPVAVGASPDGFNPGKVYKPVKTNDAGADLAAQYAVSQQAAKTKAKITFGEMIKVEDKEPKLGARDFRLCMSVVNNGKPGRAQALVSMDQYSNFKLTSWTDTNCGESKDGFTTVSNSDAGIGLAADFAVKKHSADTKQPHKLISILKGENKGMFSMTYRVCMKVAEEGETQIVQAVVSMDQYSNMKLVSWEHSKCGS